MKFSTCTIASFGWTIRKYATAFTRAGTLSFVITSCGGMFSVIVRRSTFTIRSTIGVRKKRPGPFGGAGRRPRPPPRPPLPQLAADEDEPAPHLARRPDKLLEADRDRPAAHLDGLRE